LEELEEWNNVGKVVDLLARHELAAMVTNW
jgi:hypothetical protein